MIDLFSLTEVLRMLDLIKRIDISSLNNEEFQAKVKAIATPFLMMSDR